MKNFNLNLKNSRASYFATFRHHLNVVAKTDALDEEKWLNMMGALLKDWFRYEQHFVHGKESMLDILNERGLLSILPNGLTYKGIKNESK